MAVIKSYSAATLLKEAVVLDLGDVGRQAARLQTAAAAKAQQVIAQAQETARQLTDNAAEQGRQQGHAEGLAQGIEEGRQQGRAQALAQASAQLQQLQKAWIAAAGEWDAARQAMDLDARQAILELALRLAEKLVHRVIQLDRSVIVDQVAHALAHVLEPTEVVVRIHPSDRPVLEEAMPELLAEFSRFRHVRIVDDMAVAAGGCVLSYGQGQIDARVQTQLLRIVELMLPGDGTDAADAAAGNGKG